MLGEVESGMAFRNCPTNGELRPRVWLRFQGREDFELEPGVTIVGRGDGCQLVLDDPLVSRQHACFVVDESSITLKDLGSTNGVLVNGARVEEMREVVPGDLIVVGRHQAELCLVRWSGAERARRRMSQPRRRAVATIVDGGPLEPAPPSREDVTESTGRGTRLAMLWSVAEKAFELGRGSEAQRILERPLEEVLETVASRAPVDLQEVERAARLAARLASHTAEARWIHYVLRLYGTICRVPSPAVVDELHAAARAATNVDVDELRQYLARLQDSPGQWGPAERFLLRRLEGLEAMLRS